MGDFKKRGNFGGSRDGGGFRGNRDSGGSSFGGGRSKFNRPGNREFRQSQMFSAVCSECKKPCEVPFRPTGDKPVFCNYCFGKNRAAAGANEFPRRDERTRDFPKRDFTPAPIARQDFNGGQNNDLKKQLDTLNFKLDKLIEMLSKTSAPVVEKFVEKKVSVTPVKKVVLKKEIKTVSKKKAVSKKK